MWRMLLLFAIAASRATAQLVQYDYNPCPQVPTLHCRNGSTCTPGVGSFGGQHEHLDLQTHESGYYCKCKDGFIGHECQLEVDECQGGSGAPSCYNGSKCQSSGGGASCDCNELNRNSGALDTKFSGAMCQHESTSFCAVSLVGNFAPNHQFCTNHGDCKKLVTGNQQHPGCDCKPGWMGEHCEIRTDPFAKTPNMNKSQAQGGNKTTSIIMFSLMIVAVVIVALLIAYQVFVAKKKTNTSSDAVFQGEKPRQASVGEGDLNPDGSGTLGSPTNGTNGVTNGDASGVEDDDDAESDAADEPSEQEIV